MKVFKGFSIEKKVSVEALEISKKHGFSLSAVVELLLRSWIDVYKEKKEVSELIDIEGKKVKKHGNRG